MAPILEVVVVCENNDWVGASDEQVSPVFEASDDGQEFSVVDVVVSFSWIECLEVISYRSLPSCPFVFLI